MSPDRDDACDDNVDLLRELLAHERRLIALRSQPASSPRSATRSSTSPTPSSIVACCATTVMLRDRHATPTSDRDDDADLIPMRAGRRLPGV